MKPAKALNKSKKKKMENLQKKEEKMDQIDGRKKQKLGSLTEFYLEEKRKKEQDKEERLIKCKKI